MTLHRYVKPLRELNTTLYERPVTIVARTPIQKQRDADGTQFSRMRPSILEPKETLYIAPEPVEKGSMAQKLPDYHHPPQTDPCMTVCDYIDSKRANKEYKTSYSAVFNDRHGYGKLSDQPRDPMTNRRLASKPIVDKVTKPAERNPYAPVKKCLESFQDRINKLTK